VILTNNMNFYFIIVSILILSLILALRSLKDLEPPKEVKNLMRKNKNLSGVILFLKEKVRHYSSRD